MLDLVKAEGQEKHVALEKEKNDVREDELPCLLYVKWWIRNVLRWNAL